MYHDDFYRYISQTVYSLDGHYGTLYLHYVLSFGVEKDRDLKLS